MEELRLHEEQDDVTVVTEQYLIEKLWS